MALNYDTITNRLRTFRFSHGNDVERLRQERVQDVLDIEEYGELQNAKNILKIMTFSGTLLVQPFHFAFGRTAFFKGLNPYIRVTLRTAFLFAPFVALRAASRCSIDQMYSEMLAKKVTQTYEEPLTLKYRELTV
ncbi:hypothetical protein SteCoe_20779 [Stentor coeruleus]|uniref:Uncharacterized protein n=1 Tax=Stentor coeruleus TaxID=5963 RepID=A0A1R2BRA0_9CILI|nr:hypothetical protein SteCoe_20779 [Stentor coeruleus]